MNQNNSILFFIIIFIIISNFPASISSANVVDQRFLDCAPVRSTCGFQLKIAYPFYDSRQEDNCGHPSFKLDCEQNSSLTITIENQKYTILNINYTAKVFTISKPEFSKDACLTRSSQMVNSTLDTNLYSFSSNTQNATLFYDCQSFELGTSPPYGFSCSVSDPYKGGRPIFNSSLSFMSINTTWEEELNKNCKFQMYVPILKTAAAELVNGDSNINKVLEGGFEVKWLVEDDGQCEECSKSGGICGYNYTLNQPACFCQNDSSCYRLNYGSYAGTGNLSYPTGKISKGITSVALGIGIGICVLLTGTFCFFIYRQHRKKHKSTQFITHNKSYSPSTGASNFQYLNGSTYFGVHVFNYRELEEATEYFNPTKELGEGGFGTVYHGKLRDGREVAIKRLYENNSKRAEQFLNEVEILANLRHKNLVNLYGCTSRQSRELLLVYEYVPNGTVADHLHGKQSKLGLLTWSTRLSIATETASALVYLHESDIVHRDVKTQNILLDSEFSVKVADFGLSRLFPLDVTHVSTAPQGTPGYVDPEYHQCYQLTEKSDVYSFGVLLAELISSLPAVDITRRRNEINLSNMAINKIQNYALHEFVDPSLGYESDFRVKEEISEVAELAFHCLQSTKEMRPSMNEVLKRLVAIQDGRGSDLDSAEVVDIPADDVLMLKGDFSPTSPQNEDYHLNTRYKPNASV